MCRFRIVLILILSVFTLFGSAACKCDKNLPVASDTPAQIVAAPTEHENPVQSPSRLADANTFVVATSLGIHVTVQDVLDVQSSDSSGLGLLELIRVALGYKIASNEAQMREIVRLSDESWTDYVDRFLRLAFNPESSCRNIAVQDMVRHLAGQKRRYQHPDIFHVVDAQTVCCPKEKAPCVGDADADTCFANAVPVMERAFVRAKSLTTDRASFERAVTPESAETGQITVIDYRFAYDYEQPHHAQPGNWVVMDPAIVQGVRRAQSGDVLPPIRSEYGIHLLYVLEHRLKSTGDLADPAVSRRVRDDLCVDVVAKARARYIQDLTDGYPLELNEDGLQRLQDHLDVNNQPIDQPGNHAITPDATP